MISSVIQGEFLGCLPCGDIFRVFLRLEERKDNQSCSQHGTLKVFMPTKGRFSCLMLQRLVGRMQVLKRKLEDIDQAMNARRGGDSDGTYGRTASLAQVRDSRPDRMHSSSHSFLSSNLDSWNDHLPDMMAEKTKST
eukprot:745622-Hanusia_phi.AAC.2